VNDADAAECGCSDSTCLTHLSTQQKRERLFAIPARQSIGAVISIFLRHSVALKRQSRFDLALSCVLLWAEPK
jgi:hypothetical protein